MTGAAVLERRKLVKDLLVDRGDLMVVCGLGSPTYDVAAAGDHPLNFYLWAAMGGAAMIGLGLALAKPERRVAVITGDGEQLMGMGGLGTIGVKRPRNLVIVVLDIIGRTGAWGRSGFRSPARRRCGRGRSRRGGGSRAGNRPRSWARAGCRARPPCRRWP